MRNWEKVKCYQISSDISDSIDIFGTLTKEELKEYIDLIFKAENIVSKNLLEMKKFIYKTLLNKKIYYVENLQTGELKKYKQQKDMCKDIGVQYKNVSNYLSKGTIFKKTYMFMTMDKIRA